MNTGKNADTMFLVGETLRLDQDGRIVTVEGINQAPPRTPPWPVGDVLTCRDETGELLHVHSNDVERMA